MLKLVKVTHEIEVFHHHANNYMFTHNPDTDAETFTFIIDTIVGDDELVGRLVECETRVDTRATLGVVVAVIPFEERNNELRRIIRFKGLMPCFLFESEREANWALRAFLAENPPANDDEEYYDEDEGYDFNDVEDEDDEDEVDETEEKEDEEELVF